MALRVQLTTQNGHSYPLVDQSFNIGTSSQTVTSGQIGVAGGERITPYNPVRYTYITYISAAQIVVYRTRDNDLVITRINVVDEAARYQSEGNAGRTCVPGSFSYYQMSQGNWMNKYNYNTPNGRASGDFTTGLGSNVYRTDTIVLGPGQNTGAMLWSRTHNNPLTYDLYSFLTLTNTYSRPANTKPTFAPNCRANVANGNTIIFDSGGDYGYCYGGKDSASYEIYDNDQFVGVLKKGNEASPTVSGLSPNTRYWAKFTKSNGCFTETATCSAVTVTPNNLSDLQVLKWNEATARLAITYGGGEYKPNTTIWVKSCNGGTWTQKGSSNTTTVATIDITGLEAETCYQVQARTTTPAGTYTGNTIQFTTPSKNIAIATITGATTSIDEEDYNVCANACYSWKANIVPAKMTLNYRIKDGYDDQWLQKELPDVTTNTGTGCIDICDLYPNQTVYESYIHTENTDGTYDSPLYEFMTPVMLVPEIHTCETLEYLTELLCQAVVALYRGQKEIYANDCSKELCDPNSQNPTMLTLWSRALRLFHTMSCILCKMGDISFTASKENQYLTGEAGWVDILEKIDESDTENGWKLATSDAIKTYIEEKLKEVWHYQGTVDVLVYQLSDLDDYPNAETAIVTSENKIYKKVSGSWVVDTSIIPEDLGVWHINMESDTQAGFVQQGAGWYSWEGNWKPLDADVDAMTKIIDEIYKRYEDIVQTEDGADLHIDVVDKNSFNCSKYKNGERWLVMITEPQTQPAPVYHTITFVTGLSEIVMSSQKVVDGALAQKPVDPSFPAFTFNNWKDQATGQVFNWSTVIKKDYTLVADWTKSAYIVSFDANGGTPTPSDQFVPFAARTSNLMVEPTDVIRLGYDLKGWYDASVTPKTYWDFDSDIPTKDTTLTADWQPHNYSVTYMTPYGLSMDGSTPTPTRYNINTPAWTVPDKAFTSSSSQANHEFKGWGLKRGDTPQRNLKIDPQQLLKNSEDGEGIGLEDLNVYPQFASYVVDINFQNADTGVYGQNSAASKFTYDLYIDGALYQKDVKDSVEYAATNQVWEIKNIRMDEGATFRGIEIMGERLPVQSSYTIPVNNWGFEIIMLWS